MSRISHLFYLALCFLAIACASEKKADTNDRTIGSRKIDDVSYLISSESTDKIDLKGGEDHFNCIMEVKMDEHRLAAVMQDPAKLRLLNFGLAERIMLVTEVDTVPCVFSHFEQRGNLSGSLVFHLGFANDKVIQQPKKIIFNDDILDYGPIVIPFNNSLL